MKIPKPLQADLALLVVTLIWGSTFTIVKKCLAQVSPLLFIALRFWVATVVTVVCMPRGLRGISFQTLRRGMLLSVLLVGGFIFQTIGLRGTTPSRSAFITSLAVVLVPVFGLMIFHHRPKPQTLLGVALAITGIALLTLTAIELKFRYGDLLTLICALVFALHMLFLGRYLPTSDYRQLIILQLAGGALICTAAMPMLETPFLVWDVSFTFYLFITGVLATGFAYYSQTRAQQYTTPNRTALIFSLEPF
ncbi:MAG TPA: DMT family transporter, partial [Acidobacteriota bacterium]|nr:DMT family transporter [Acidobacteriota bacterium]